MSYNKTLGHIGRLTKIGNFTELLNKIKCLNINIKMPTHHGMNTTKIIIGTKKSPDTIKAERGYHGNAMKLFCFFKRQVIFLALFEEL